MTNKQSYEMIQAGGAGAAALERGEEGSLIAGTEPQRKGWVGVAPALAAAIGVALLLACGLSAHSGDAGDASAAGAAATPMQASTDSVPSCSLLSCTSSGCDWDGAPFLCLDGGSARGCADSASTWSGGDSCTSFCDLSGCADTLENAGVDDLLRRCLDCDETQCSTLAGQPSQACGSAAPFVCLSGAATWGCTNNELAWASVPSTTCGECCDVSGC
ncbi:unnamed protein product [Ectocarpus fasciculatus]